jgi:UDP-glucose 4-epimerase
LSFYGISKKSAEEYVSYFHRHGLDTTVFRMFSVYGPGQDLMNMQQGMLSIYLKFVIDGLPIRVTGSRDRFRDFIFIDDVTDAWVSVLNSPASSGRTYNLGTGVKTHVWEIISTILAVTGQDGNYPVEYGKTGKDDQMGLIANMDRICNDLNWRPKWSLSDGLTEMIRWAGFAGKNTVKGL